MIYGLRVVYYARVSTEKEEQINSLENQVEFFEDYIEKNTNWAFIQGYVDEGISGTTSLKRESFMQMIEDAKQDKFDLVITKEVSRFSRDTIDSLLYTRKLLEYDVCVYFLSDNIITASNDGELRLTIMSSMAQDEVRKISERTKFGFKRAVEKGIVLGTNNIWGYRKDKGKLVIDKKEALLIKTIFDTYANNTKIGLKRLSDDLLEQGFTNRNGNAIHQNTLKRIIQNQKYKGYYTGGLSTVIDYRSKKRQFKEQTEWTTYKDFERVPPIVSEELWEKANQKLSSRSKSAAMHQKRQTIYPLSGKLHCEKHECGFVRKIRPHKNGEDVIYWYCSDFHKFGRKHCMPACFKEQDLYTILLSIFSDFEIYNEKIYNELYLFYIDVLKQNNNIDEKVSLQQELDMLRNKKDRLLDLALDGILSKEDLSKKKIVIENQIEQIQRKLKQIEVKQQEKIKETKHYNKTLKENILKELKITQENLENYIEGLVDKIVVVEKEESNIELQIVLVGENLINYCSPKNLGKSVK